MSKREFHQCSFKLVSVTSWLRTAMFLQCAIQCIFSSCNTLHEESAVINLLTGWQQRSKVAYRCPLFCFCIEPSSCSNLYKARRLNERGSHSRSCLLIHLIGKLERSATPGTTVTRSKGGNSLWGEEQL